nr:immunoglobulin heavy chain junction region [Mus musculus]
CARDLPFTYW